jgi:glycosyltransferase involved in cell wall biosynthesis
LQVTLIGHPFSPIGAGRALRVAFGACRCVGIEPAVRDIWNYHAPEPAQQIIEPFLTTKYGAINIFHLNGDEIKPALARLGPLPPGYNIVSPAWELPRYPTEWALQLERFDEVWAISRFVRDSIADAVDRPTIHMPHATEVVLNKFLGRRRFGIPEGAYAFLCLFDCRSFVARKNPQAAVECFRRVLSVCPWSRACLVVKLHGAEQAPVEVEEFFASMRDLEKRVVILTETTTENEVHNLIRCCDALVSLHRSEGYGLSLAEGMFLGLPVIATAYSGNMDFMTSENSILIGYHLVSVKPGDYPHAEDQQWAEPDLEEAATRMLELIDDPAMGRGLGARASRDMRIGFSYRACGLRYLRRLSEITGKHVLFRAQRES